MMDSAPLPHPKPDVHEKRKFYFADTFQRRALVALFRACFLPIMHYEVHGLEHFPREGGVVLAANHVTHFDVFPMQFALPRTIFFMAKAELFKNPVMDIILRNLSAFPVTRGDKDLWAMRHAAKVLKHGQVLGMFPEGTRSRGGGLKVAKTGAAKLALEAECPIVPLAVVGSDQFFKKFPRRVRVQILLLPPIYPEPHETPLALTDRLMFTLARALPAEMRGVYTETPQGFDS